MECRHPVCAHNIRYISKNSLNHGGPIRPHHSLGYMPVNNIQNPIYGEIVGKCKIIRQRQGGGIKYIFGASLCLGHRPLDFKHSQEWVGGLREHLCYFACFGNSPRMEQGLGPPFGGVHGPVIQEGPLLFCE